MAYNLAMIGLGQKATPAVPSAASSARTISRCSVLRLLGAAPFWPEEETLGRNAGRDRQLRYWQN